MTIPTTTAEAPAEAPAESPDWLLPLGAWLSPAYPVGAYSYSHGIEWAVETGAIRNREDLAEYIATVLEQGGGWADLVLLAAAWRAGPDIEALTAIADLATAWRGTAETALEAAQQGSAFCLATRAAWAGTPLDALAARRGNAVSYAVAVGAAASGTIPLAAILLGYAQAVATNLISAGMRLVPLGQTDGQRCLAALVPILARSAGRAAETPLDELGTAAALVDLASMRHETQYSRLFRS